MKRNEFLRQVRALRGAVDAEQRMLDSAYKVFHEREQGNTPLDELADDLYAYGDFTHGGGDGVFFLLVKHLSKESRIPEKSVESLIFVDSDGKRCPDDFLAKWISDVWDMYNSICDRCGCRTTISNPYSLNAKEECPHCGFSQYLRPEEQNHEE